MIVTKNKTNLIDVFVCFDKVNGELPQGSWSWVTKALGHVPLKYQKGKSQHLENNQYVQNVLKSLTVYLKGLLIHLMQLRLHNIEQLGWKNILQEATLPGDRSKEGSRLLYHIKYCNFYYITHSD